jgi:hypothetical protein
MPTIETTIGASDANSFVTLDEAIEYLDGQLNADAFCKASDANQKRALIQAARVMDRWQWVGSQVDSTQALAWPRYDVEDPDGVGLSECPLYYPPDEIPQRVKDAQCELALALIAKTYSPNGNKSRDLKRWQSDGVSIEYADTATDTKQIPDAVIELVGVLLAGNRKRMA